MSLVKKGKLGGLALGVAIALALVVLSYTGTLPWSSPAQALEPPVPEEGPKRVQTLEPLPPRTGAIPPPMDLSHLKGDRIPEGVRVATLPSRFDWREQGKVTSVKNQGQCGSCYAFASIGNIEAELLIDGAGSFNLSENNAKECNWQEQNGQPVGSCDGGNYWMLANLFSQRGTVLESCDPYVAADVPCKSTCPYQQTLLDWRVISGDAVPNTEVLKAYIMASASPVYTHLYAGDSYDPAWQSQFQNYDGSGTLYYPGTSQPNHAVLIVGWDDSLSHQGGTGAWIVKNSWGTNWGGTAGHGTERGYFTIAYGSASIGKWSSYVHAWQNYDTNGAIMYYDEAGWMTSWGYGGTTAWGLAEFTPVTNTNITRVEFWTTDQTTDVDVYIYDSFDETNLSGLLASKLNNSFDEAGYHSVMLNSPLSVASGNDVFAVVKFTNASYGLPIAADNVGPNETGRTYISSAGTSWYDLGAGKQDDVAIRLRTSSAGNRIYLPSVRRSSP